MKKQILNIGNALNKAEQKSINGGAGGGCATKAECKVHCRYGECVDDNPITGHTGCFFCDHRLED